jgi:hypothetical protein
VTTHRLGNMTPRLPESDIADAVGRDGISARNARPRLACGQCRADRRNIGFREFGRVDLTSDCAMVRHLGGVGVLSPRPGDKVALIAAPPVLAGSGRAGSRAYRRVVAFVVDLVARRRRHAVCPFPSDDVRVADIPAYEYAPVTRRDNRSGPWMAGIGAAASVNVGLESGPVVTHDARRADRARIAGPSHPVVMHGAPAKRFGGLRASIGMAARSIAHVSLLVRLAVPRGRRERSPGSFRTQILPQGGVA